MYSLENLHNIEVLVFSNYAFSLEVLMDEHETPAKMVRISLTTHEVILAIAVWEKRFGFMIRPQRPETHVSFKKLAPGSWRVALQGSKENLLKILQATNFEVIRFLVSGYSTQDQSPEDSFFGYSVRVPLTRLASKLDIFLKELDGTTQLLELDEEASPSYSSQHQHTQGTFGNDGYSDQSQSITDSEEMMENHANVAVTLPLTISSSHGYQGFQRPSALDLREGVSRDESSTWSRISPRAQEASARFTETTTTHNSENTNYIKELIRLSKCEVSAIVGPQCRRIDMIQNATHCRISILPVTLESMNARSRTHDFPQTISLTGKPHQVSQAKIMIRRALLEYRSKQ